MSDNFQPIDWNDDDVLMFGEHNLFKVSKFKQDLQAQIKYQIQNNLFNYIDGLRKLSFQNINFGLCDMNFNMNTPAIECQVLRIGANSWQKGLIRSQIFIDLDFSIEYRYQVLDAIIIKDIIIEFAPEPTETLESTSINPEQ